MTYYGSASYLMTFTPRVRTEDDAPIYGFETVSGLKRTRYFLLEQKAFVLWKRAILKAMGLPGLIH